MQYGKCLTSLLKHKRQLSPLFRNFFINGPLTGFDELLKLDVNSWDFFIKSLNFLKTFHQKFEKNNPEHAQVFYILKNEFDKNFEQWESIPYLRCLINFAEAVKNRDINHYYVETQALCDFLASVEIKNIKDMLQYIQQLDNTIFFAFHLPNNDAFTVNIKIKNDKLKIICETKGEFYNVQIPEEIKLLEFINRNPGLKMCFNAIAYTECFAQNVRLGVPEDIKDKPPKSENPKTLTPFSGIENFNQKEVSAHFRHAHFRFCGSDYYKAKKGKWVFVKGAMVNAEAKTIIEED